jgi:NAD(P)-dependent dehydrogenase (short-subunit alcohol dehydrogenase family)
VGALDGKVALVAGASSGIGLATALAFADAGAQVHAAARRPEMIEQGAGDRAVAHALDVGDRTAVGELAETIGPLHALVVAAGINIKRRRFEETSPEDWDRVVATNLTGAFNLVHAFLPALRETRGTVVLIGSVSGNFTDRSGTAYQASKAGMHALARGAAFDEEHGVRFTIVAPGVVDTPILENRPQVPDAEMRAQMLQPEDVAAACLFAVSLPPRAYVPELTILPTALQAIGRTS